MTDGVFARPAQEVEEENARLRLALNSILELPDDHSSPGVALEAIRRAHRIARRGLEKIR